MNGCYCFMSGQVVDDGSFEARDGSNRYEVRNNVLQGVLLTWLSRGRFTR